MQSRLAGSQSQPNLNQSGVTAITGMSLMKDVLAQQQAKPALNIGAGLQGDDDNKSQMTAMTYGQAFKMMRAGQKKMQKKPPRRGEQEIRISTKKDPAKRSMAGSEKGSQFGDMRSVASKSDMPSYGGILDRSGAISINTDVYKAFGVESVKARPAEPPAAKIEEEEAPADDKAKDFDPARELPLEDSAARRPQAFLGSALNVGAVQNALLASMANQEPQRPGAAGGPAGPRPGQGQVADRKVSIYDLLKQKQKMRREIEAKEQAQPPAPEDGQPKD